VSEIGEVDPGGDLTDLREQNLRRLLSVLLEDRDGLTQSELVDRTNLSRSTVSSLTALLEGVLVSEPVKGAPERGRPVLAWHVDPSSAYSIGIDIGRTHVTVVATDAYGDVCLGPLTEPVQGILKRPHHVLGVVAEMLQRLVDHNEIFCDHIAAVTIGLPGPVEVTAGTMNDAAAPAWSGLDVREEVRKRWPRSPVPHLLADNDANLGAIAEHRSGAGIGAQSALFIKWSSGIGGGLILNGWLWHGSTGVAGEIGHLPVQVTPVEAASLRLDPDPSTWPRCVRCGQSHCLELLAGGQTVAAATRHPDFDAVIEAVLQPRQADDPHEREVREVLEVAARLIGRAVGPTLTLLDVERVIIGGIAGQPGLYPLLAEAFADGLSETGMTQALADASLEIGALGRVAPVEGAALAGFDWFGVTYLLEAAEAAREADLAHVS